MRRISYRLAYSTDPLEEDEAPQREPIGGVLSLQGRPRCGDYFTGGSGRCHSEVDPTAPHAESNQFEAIVGAPV